MSEIDWDSVNKKIKRFSLENQIKLGKCVDVYDGDTITIVGHVKYNPDLFRFSVRLNGIDCPEMKGKNDNEKIVAKFAKQYIQDIIYDKIVTLEDVALDKYGRVLAKVMFGHRDIAKELLEKNMAVAYDGGTKEKSYEELRQKRIADGSWTYGSDHEDVGYQGE